MHKIFSILVCIAVSMPALSAGLDAISNSDATGGLKQALTDGSAAAVSQLGVEDGFFGHPKVRIPLPPSLPRIEGPMRLLGM